MKTQMSLLLAAAVGAILLGFNNCSGVGFTATSDSTQKGLGTPDPGDPGTPSTPLPPGPDPRVPQIVKNCNDAVAAGTIKTLTQNIDFNDTKLETGRSQVCQFNTGDNLSMLDSHMRARYEQTRTLNLPANAVICDVQMTTAQQKFSYDDILFLTFNGVIMGSNNKSAITSKLSVDSSAQLSNGKLVPLYKYDWLGLRDASFANVADDYCLGADQKAGTCQWPVTEMTGNIIFEWDPSLLITLALRQPANQQTFGMVITGDNDPSSDCYHQDLQFSMQVRYYQQ